MSTQAFAPEKAKGFCILQPQATHTGAPIREVPRGLPKTTESLCPECGKVITALLREDGGKVVMEKQCREHGEFRDIVYSDVELYLKMEQWTFGDNRGIANPMVADAKSCPDDCGLCSMHTSHTGLANIDLTNACNLTCPVCFANANTAGYLYEPGLEHIRRMLLTLRETKPVAGRIVQFSGGEPTIYPRFFDVLRMAKEMGFSHLQAATNGIKFADLEFAQQAAEAGLHTLYLQFDGVTDDVYRRTRGERLWETKLKAIENVKKAGLKIVFVPTIVKGLNDHQIGDIIRVALDNIECVSGISFQPVAFTGRIAKAELEAKRFTLADFAHAVKDQTGICDPYEDWFPLSCVTPFSKLIGALRGEEITTLSSHPHCAMGTYLFVDANRQATPVTQFMDMGAALQDLDREARRAGRNGLVKLFSKVNAWNTLRKHFHADRAPEGLTFTRFLQTIQGMTDKSYGRGKLDGQFTYKTLMVAGMHFMDAYNYDIERVKRCVIHYAAPDGKLYPFCTYNSGPTFRERIEKDFSVPLPAGMRLNGSGRNGCGGC
ncbi:MAG: radical SAM protein [Bryobacteraceae bacterium]|nr:radical SAM protein [Bryobacteraceae bacterium]